MLPDISDLTGSSSTLQQKDRSQGESVVVSDEKVTSCSWRIRLIPSRTGFPYLPIRVWSRIVVAHRLSRATKDLINLTSPQHDARSNMFLAGVLSCWIRVC